MDDLSLRGRTAIVTGASDGIGAVTARNAGVMRPGVERTVDGFEAHIGVNHLGHFALTQLLLESITGRVVTVSSDLHKRARLDVNDLNWEHRPVRAVQAYCDSKLANLLFTHELQRRRAAGSDVRALAAHPGLSTTNIAGAGLTGRVIRTFTGLVGQDAEGGARPTLHAAAAPLDGGTYVGPGGPFEVRGKPKVVRGSRTSQDAVLARRLWERSSELTGVDLLAAVA